MGMESYYITLDIKGGKFNDSISECFKERCSVSEYKMPSGKLFQKYIVDDRRFVIDGKAVVTVMKMQDQTAITFELCFSNFEENLSYIYNVAQWISTFGIETKLIVLNAEFDFDTLNFERFQKIVSESYNGKIQQFSARYGKMNADILPNDFYNWIRQMGINRKK